MSFSHSQWFNNYALYQDLAAPEGRGVFTRLNGVAGGHEGAPRGMPQANEANIFGPYSGSHETRPQHDLNFIQDMLQMVRLENHPPRLVPEYNTRRSMLNPNCAEFVPQHNRHNNNNYYQRPNGAFNPFEDRDMLRNQNVRFRPEDIVQGLPYERGTPPRFLTPQEIFIRNQPATVTEIVTEPKTGTYKVDFYEPNDGPNQQYNKYVERALYKPYVKNDIWTEADNKMKAEKRKRAAQISREMGLTDENQNLNLVRLPLHRHMYTEECVVCGMLRKHNYNVDLFLYLEKGL